MAFRRHLDWLGNGGNPAQNASEGGFGFLGFPWFFSSGMSFQWVAAEGGRRIFLVPDRPVSAVSATMSPERLSRHAFTGSLTHVVSLIRKE
jgi:hypothetical protein